MRRPWRPSGLMSLISPSRGRRHGGEDGVDLLPEDGYVVTEEHRAMIAGGVQQVEPRSQVGGPSQIQRRLAASGGRDAVAIAPPWHEERDLAIELARCVAA